MEVDGVAWPMVNTTAFRIELLRNSGQSRVRAGRSCDVHHELMGTAWRPIQTSTLSMSKPRFGTLPYKNTGTFLLKGRSLWGGMGIFR